MIERELAACLRTQDSGSSRIAQCKEICHASGNASGRKIMESREPRQHKSSYLSGYIGSGKKPGVLLARLIAALFVLLGLAAASAGAADCSNLLGLKLKDTVITEATVIAVKGDVPEYCRVQGGLETVILFEVALRSEEHTSELQSRR